MWMQFRAVLIVHSVCGMGGEVPEVVAVVAVVATHSVNIPSAAELCT